MLRASPCGKKCTGLTATRCTATNDVIYLTRACYERIAGQRSNHLSRAQRLMTGKGSLQVLVRLAHRPGVSNADSPSVKMYSISGAHKS